MVRDANGSGQLVQPKLVPLDVQRHGRGQKAAAILIPDFDCDALRSAISHLIPSNARCGFASFPLGGSEVRKLHALFVGEEGFILAGVEVEARHV